MGIFDTQKMLMCTVFGRGAGVGKFMVCTLMKMLTVMDDPLTVIVMGPAGPFCVHPRHSVLHFE